MTAQDKVQEDQIAANAEAIQDNAEAIRANAEAIRANAEAIEDIQKQTQYLCDIRNHFIPDEEARLKRFAKYVVTPFLKVIAVVAFLGGMWDVLAWLMARHEVGMMADRYVAVAKDVYQNENNPEVAIKFLNKAIELRNDAAEYRFLRAYIDGMAATRLLLNLDRPFLKSELDRVHHAFAEARFLQELNPERPEPYLLQAQVLLALKQPDRAETNLVQALRLAPNNHFVHLRMAMLQISRKDIAGAEKSLDRALELYPKSKWAWLGKGKLANDFRNDQVAARACYEKALEIDPRFDEALYSMGESWGWGKDKDCVKAREYMHKALLVNPDYKEACYQIGMFYGYEENFGIAKVWMDKAIAIDKNYLTAHKWRGINHGDMKKFEAAIQDFDTAIQLDPMNADLYVRRAQMNERLGNLDKAMQDMRFAYDLAPNAFTTLMYIGDICVKAGQVPQALDYYDRAIAANPAFDDVHAHKADALAAQGREADALKAIEKAIELTVFKPERFWVQKGALLERFKRPADARAAYKKARTLNPKLLSAWRKELELAQAAGDTVAADAARAMCHKLERDPMGKK